MVVVRFAALALWVAVTTTPVSAQEGDMKTLIQFEEPDGVRWSIVNDGVMGGLSRGDLEQTDQGTVLFSGHLSLENNGGFASTRALLGPQDLSDYEGVLVRVRGDGRTYQLRLRTSDSFDGLAYRSEFDTEEGVWKEIRLPFSTFQPSFRGYVPRGAGPLDTRQIRQLGFLIGDKKEGPFRLEIAWVKAY